MPEINRGADKNKNKIHSMLLLRIVYSLQIEEKSDKIIQLSIQNSGISTQAKAESRGNMHPCRCTFPERSFNIQGIYIQDLPAFECFQNGY